MNNIFIHSDSEFRINPILGSHIAIDKGVYATVNCKIGDYTHIGPYVTIIGGKKGNFECQGFNNIMAGARIICGSDRFDESGLPGSMIPDEFKGKQIIETVIMEEFSNIGTNAIVLPGSILRRGVLLTAGSLLMGDTEEWGVYKGNPAVLIKKINGEKIINLSKKLKESDNLKLEVNAGGIFSKFIFLIQNIKKINPNFKSLYVANLDQRSLVGKQNIFDHIFEQRESSDQVSYVCQPLGNYTKFFPIEDSLNLNEYKKIVKRLKFHKNIEDELNFYINSLKIDKNCIGVHIRLGDMNSTHGNDYGVLFFENFVKEINSIKKENQKIFVASDNHESIEKLKCLYGDDVIYVEDFIRGSSEIEDTLILQMENFKIPKFWKEAFIEMLLLSKCGSLICRTSNLSNVSIIYSETIKNIIRI